MNPQIQHWIHDRGSMSWCGAHVWSVRIAKTLEEVTCQACPRNMKGHQRKQRRQAAQDEKRQAQAKVHVLTETEQIHKVTQRTADRLAAQDLLPITPPLPHTYVGMAADYGETTPSVLREALYRNEARGDMDCDEWTHELQRRSITPDVTSLWVLEANLKIGWWWL